MRAVGSVGACLFAVALGIGVVGCASDDSSDDTGTDDVVKGTRVTLTEKDNGTTVSAKEGQLVVVKLTEKAAAGYLWRVEAIEGTLGDPEKTAEAASPAVGGPRTAVFTWKTDGKAGTHTIALKHSRGAPGDVADTFKITLKVTGGARACPSQSSINCMPPIRPSVAELCNREFRDWAEAHCNVRYLN
jgi:predicted secreted protein